MQIMTISAEMVLPGLAGLWLDNRLGTKIVFTLIGFAIGLPLSLWHLLRITKAAQARSRETDKPSDGTLSS